MNEDIDITRARLDTPGCGNVIHFNNAGASLMPRPVLKAITEHLYLEAAIGGYEAAARAHDAVEHVYYSISKLLNCEPGEIAVIENATRAWDMAFYSIQFTPGDIILTSVAEYASDRRASDRLHLGILKCGIVSFTIDGHRPEDIGSKLARQNINVTYSLAEYTRLDMEARGLDSLIRASVHYYNTEEEIDRFCETLREIASCRYQGLASS
jgi:selenocysteine lyase/cysteine desulfurase